MKPALDMNDPVAMGQREARKLSRSFMQHCKGSNQFAVLALEWLPHLRSLNVLQVFIVLCAHADKNEGMAGKPAGTVAGVIHDNAWYTIPAAPLEGLGSGEAWARKLGARRQVLGGDERDADVAG